MKKMIVGVFCFTILTGCSGLISPLDRGDKIPTDQAVIVGMIKLTPMVDEDGEVTSDADDDFQTVFITLSGDQTNIKKDDDNNALQEFDEVETNRFFALPVEIVPKMQINDLQFVIRRSRWYSNTEYIYHTDLLQVKFPFNQELKPGGVYSIGTIHIELAEKSFNRDEDEEEFEEVRYIVPKSMKLNTDATAASEWFKKEFPKSGKNVTTLSPSMKLSDTPNSYTETQIVTTHVHR